MGWKYEVEGNQKSIIRVAEKQMLENLTDACVVNGPAYGDGYGIVKPGVEYEHLESRRKLFSALERFINTA